MRKIILTTIFLIGFLFLTSKGVFAASCDGHEAPWCYPDNPIPSSCTYTGDCSGGSCSGPTTNYDWAFNCCHWNCEPNCPNDNINACTSSCDECDNTKPCPGHPPVSGGQCDSSCINQCGYRKGDGSCTTDNSCCHRACVGNQCQTVAGSGNNDCSNDSDCGNRPSPTPTITPTPCPPECISLEWGQDAARRYCQSKNPPVNCTTYVLPLTCHSATINGQCQWGEFGTDCRPPYCEGCACVGPTATPILTPAACPTLVPPSGLVCDMTNNRVYWNAVAGTEYYPLRIDANFPSYNEGCKPENPGDICADVSGTSYNYNFQTNTPYGIWVHAYNSCGWSEATWVGCNSSTTPSPVQPTPTGATPILSSCRGITYTVNPASPVAGQPFTINASRQGATSCYSDWNEVGYKLDGNTCLNATSLCFADGTHCNDGYHWYFNNGLSTGAHTFRLTVHTADQADPCNCICNPLTINIIAPTATPVQPTPTGCVPQCPFQPSLVGSSCLDATNVGLTWSGNGWGKVCGITQTNKFWLFVAKKEDADGNLSDNPDSRLFLKRDMGTAENYQVSGLTDGQEYYWQVVADNGDSSCNSWSGILAFTCSSAKNSWFQTKDGDVYARGDLVSDIGCDPICGAGVCQSYLSLDGEINNPGLISRSGGILKKSSESLPEANYSSQKWNTQNTYAGSLVKFDYLANRIGISKTENFCSGGGACDLPSADGTYYHGPAVVEINGKINISNKIVIFSEGQVKIKGDITINKRDGFLAVIAKNGITFAKEVKNVQGFYLSDMAVSTEPGNQDTDKFVGKGSFIGWGGINLGRLLNKDTNKCYPAERFESFPELYLNMPQNFMFSSSWFWEAAP